jgi:hypothetical protein
VSRDLIRRSGCPVVVARTQADVREELRGEHPQPGVDGSASAAAAEVVTGKASSLVSVGSAGPPSTEDIPGTVH